VALWLFGAVVVSAGTAVLAAVSLAGDAALSVPAAPLVIAAVESPMLARSAPLEQPAVSKINIPPKSGARWVNRSYLNMWLSLLRRYYACSSLSPKG